MSYTTFDYRDFKVSGGETDTASFTVTNTGKIAGADVPQGYLTVVDLAQRAGQPVSHGVGPGLDGAAVRSERGRMFWLWWKTLSGSYVVFTSTSRS